MYVYHDIKILSCFVGCTNTALPNWPGNTGPWWRRWCCWLVERLQENCWWMDGWMVVGTKPLPNRLHSVSSSGCRQPNVSSAVAAGAKPRGGPQTPNFGAVACIRDILPNKQTSSLMANLGTFSIGMISVERVEGPDLGQPVGRNLGAAGWILAGTVRAFGSCPIGERTVQLRKPKVWVQKLRLVPPRALRL